MIYVGTLGTLRVRVYHTQKFMKFKKVYEYKKRKNFDFFYFFIIQFEKSIILSCFHVKINLFVPYFFLCINF